MNVNQIKTIFLVLAAIAKGTHACNVAIGFSCGVSFGCCMGALECETSIGGDGECRYPLGEVCDISDNGGLYQCFQGEFGSIFIFHMIMQLSIFLFLAAA